MEDPIEVLSPSRDHIFVVCCVEQSGDHVPFAPLDNLLLDLIHSSMIKVSVSGIPGGRMG